MTEIFLKVDIDTKRGFLKGVPALLDMFRQLDVRASFYVSMGPDNSGRAIRRVLRPGFLSKMRRTNAVGTYGFPTIIYGVLWPGPMIGTSNDALLRRIVDEGHELGIHGYDHVRWHDSLGVLPPEAIRAEVARALAIYRKAIGSDPQGFAAPGWMWNAKAQELFRAFPFAYTSNSRGMEPYYPVLDGVRYDLLEIPTTLPTLDEVLGSKARTSDELLSYFLPKMHHHSLHVFTLHAELEGMGYAGWFLNLLKHLKEEGAQFRPLRDLAARCRENAAGVPRCDLYLGQVDGRATDVALQGLGAKLPAPAGIGD